MKIDIEEYETYTRRLKEIVSKMQDAYISFDENIKLYNEGIELYNSLKELLENYRSKIKVIENNEIAVIEDIDVE